MSRLPYGTLKFKYGRLPYARFIRGDEVSLKIKAGATIHHYHLNRCVETDEVELIVLCTEPPETIYVTIGDG